MYDPYDKEWDPVFYRDDAVQIGAQRDLTSAFGEPSEGTILANANERLSIVDTRDASVVEVTGLEGAVARARAAPKGFIVVTATGDERRLWRVARDGELYEYAPNVEDGGRRTNQVVARTLRATRVIYSDASLKAGERPYVRLDTKTRYGVGVFTAR